MKNLILILSLLTSFKVQSADFVQNNFWYAPKPAQLKLKIESLQESLAEECNEHYNTLSNFTELNAEDVVFYNALPLKKQMGSKFLAIFRVKTLTTAENNPETKNQAKLQNPLLKLNVDQYSMDLQNAAVRILSVTSESLSAMSAKAGGKVMAPTFKINSVMSDEMFLTTERRDVACDIINARMQLGVSTKVQYILSENSARILASFTEQLSTGINSILNKNESAYLKAAKIGLLTAKLQSEPEATPQLIEYIFNMLFISNSLNLSPIWQLKSDNSLYLAPNVSVIEQTDNILIEM